MLANEPQFKLPLKPAIPLAPAGSDTFHLPLWPGGNPWTLRQAARSWRTLASEVQSHQHHAGQSINQLTGGWSGPAATQFTSYWDSYAAEMGKAVDSWNKFADELDAAASHIEKAHHSYEVAVETFTAFTVLSIVADVITSGATSATTVESVDEGLAVIARLLIELNSLLRAVAGVLQISVDELVGVVKFFQAVVMDLAEQSTNNVLDGQSWTKVSLTDAIAGGVLGGVAGGLVGSASGAADTTLLDQRVQGELISSTLGFEKMGATGIYQELKNQPTQ